MRILAVGDLHLGRPMTRLPADLAEQEAERFGPAPALRRITEQAAALQVDAVAFAGDLVDQPDDFFEAYAALRRAVDSLTREGIRVIAVAGNHDMQILPRLAAEVPGVHLLGADGRWEALEITGADGTTIRVHGWSFPEPVVTRSPLQGARLAGGDIPTLGLLHCDRDQPGSRHAPVTRGELEAANLDAWLLGHIHRPDPLSPATPSGYLGSATALRASETGPRGAWLYTITPQGITGVEPQTVAPLRWESLDVALDGIEHPLEGHERLLAAARDRGNAIAAAARPPELVGLRVALCGRTRFGQQVLAQLERETLDDLPLPGGIRAFVGALELDTRPEIDLTELARARDPIGHLARRLLILDDPGHPEHAPLVERLSPPLLEAHREAHWQRLDPEPPACSAWLRTATRQALEALLDQREARP